MHEAQEWGVGLLAGLALGGLFFGGLWWTVRRGVEKRLSAPWYMLSTVLRLALALAGIYLVSAGQWRRIVACLAGFAAARALSALMVGGRPQTPGAEGGHALEP